MLRLYACLTEDHDLRLVVVAVVVCVFACFWGFGLLGRVRHAATHRGRLGWLLAAAAVTGGGVWATHLVAMLAYRPGVPVGYEGGATALSIAIAIAVMLAGFAVGLLSEAWAPAGGALVGGGIGAMHFTGMAALNLPATLLWDDRFVVAALVVGVGGGALAVWIGAQ